MERIQHYQIGRLCLPRYTQIKTVNSTDRRQPQHHRVHVSTKITHHTGLPGTHHSLAPRNKLRREKGVGNLNSERIFGEAPKAQNYGCNVAHFKFPHLNWISRASCTHWPCRNSGGCKASFSSETWKDSSVHSSNWNSWRLFEAVHTKQLPSVGSLKVQSLGNSPNTSHPVTSKKQKNKKTILEKLYPKRLRAFNSSRISPLAPHRTTTLLQLPSLTSDESTICAISNSSTASMMQQSCSEVLNSIDLCSQHQAFNKVWQWKSTKFGFSGSNICQISQTPAPSAGMQGKSASEEKLSQYVSRDPVNLLMIISIVITKHLCLCLPLFAKELPMTQWRQWIIL